MRKIFFIFLLFLSLTRVSAQQIKDFNLTPTVKEVTLFLNGAEVRSLDNVSLKKGETKFIMSGLTPFMRDESLQLSLSDGVEIVSVAIREVKSDLKSVNKEAAQNETKIRQVEDQVKSVEIKQDALMSEKKMLMANQYIGGQQSGVSLIELGKAADFFRERIFKINSELRQLDRAKEAVVVTLDSLKKNQQKLIEGTTTTRKEVVVLVSSPADQTARLNIRYVVDNASWEPSYDIIATDIAKPVTLKYKARITNETGIDWNNVKITLSTSDPTLSASRPVLTAWTLNYTSQGNEGYLQNRAANFANADTVRGSTEISVEELSSSFEIAKSYSIKGNTEPHTIDVLQQSLNATYQYLTIPKVESSAFLIAKVTGWQKLNLIDGSANVYFGNTYIGQSEILTRQISDTLELSFGRDNQILVSRAKLEDTGGTKMIGTKRTESLLYEISVKNNRKAPITIKIQDQIPVSQETDINVDATEISGASLDNLSGRLQWLKTLSPDQGIKLRIAFSVKYPKNKNVVVRKQRVVRTPRYRKY